MGPTQVHTDDQSGDAVEDEGADSDDRSVPVGQGKLGDAPAPAGGSVVVLPEDVRLERGYGVAVAWFALVAFGIAVLGVTIAALVSETGMYDKLLMQAREATRQCPTVYLVYSAALAPFRTFAWFRSAVVCLSFVMIFTGAAFVLGRVRAVSTLSGKVGEFEASVKSPYPGVAMMAMGAVLVGAGLFRNASPSVTPGTCVNNPRWARGAGAAEFAVDESIPPMNPSAAAASSAKGGPNGVESQGAVPSTSAEGQ